MLTQKAQVVGNRKRNWFERSYLISILGALAITGRHFFKRKATVQYPETVRKRSVVTRGYHVLKRDAEGRENCTACGLCAVACPAEAITMDAAETQSGEEHLYREEKYASKYEINMLRCIFCGLCEEACPKDAIYMTDRIVPVGTSREFFIFGKDQLVEGVAPDERVDISKRQSPLRVEHQSHQSQ